MDPKFWQERWQEGRIGFHKSEPNPIIIKYFSKLGLAPGARVLVPLCGKSVDIPWLAKQGFQVVGAELSDIAVADFFKELGVEPTITEVGPLKKHSAPSIDIFLGDIFELTKDVLHREAGPIDGIYDRAALVALPLAIRSRYSAHLRAITDTAPQLLSCFEYDTSLIDGPPFAITEKGIRQQYDSSYTIVELDRWDYDNQLKGQDIPAIETVWQLTAKA